MSKTLIGNFKGPKGDRGDAGDTGIRGSRWNSGIAITGTSNAATVFGNSGIEDALKNDMYLNTETGNTYRCTVGGTADTAKWVYAGNIKGKQGDKGEKGDPGQEGGGSIATKEDAGSVKPADGLTVEEDGTLKVNIDGTTLTMDQVNNIIKLADTLKDAINGAFPAANVANNQITTVEGFALDARQANPNIDGSLAKQISDLNGSLKNDINTLNPSGAIRLYANKAIGNEGAGWYRFAKITCDTGTTAKGSTYILIETLIRQTFSNGLGCFHKIDFYLIYSDSARISVTGHNSGTLKKVRIVRNDNKIFLDVYSNAVINETEILSFIPLSKGIQSTEHVEAYLVPEISDGEVIVCSVDLADNI